MKGTKTVQSVDRAIKILKCFSERQQELKLTEIAEYLDLNKSTAHGIVSTLKYHGLLEQNEENQKYKLGLKLIEFGEIASNSIDILKIAPPILSELSNRINETIHIGKLDGMNVFYIYKQESDQSMRIYSTIGSKNPAHCTGLGKVLLANESPEFLDRMIPVVMERKTQKTIVDRQSLLVNLKTIKEQGYGIDDEEFAEGLVCVATPIYDKDGKVLYAMSTSGPIFRMNGEKLDFVIEAMKDAAMKLSRKCGYTDN